MNKKKTTTKKGDGQINKVRVTKKHVYCVGDVIDANPVSY